MPAIGGSVESITINGRTFGVAADAEVQKKLGGSENEVEANGDGATVRLIKTKVPWSLSGVVVEVDDLAGDHEFLVDLSNQSDFFPVVLTYASGESYQGTGQLTGELQSSSQKATAELNLTGPGQLTKQ